MTLPTPSGGKESKMSDNNGRNVNQFSNQLAYMNTPLVSKGEWIEAGLFVKLAPTLCKELGVSMQYVANARLKYRGDPDFPVGAPYNIHAVKFHTIEEYLAAGIFSKPIAQVAREMGVGPDAVASARAKIRMNPPPGIDPELIKPQHQGYNHEARARRLAAMANPVKPVAAPLNPPVADPGDPPKKRRGNPPKILDREQLLRALLTSYNWKGAMEKLGVGYHVFINNVEHHGFQADAERIKGYVKG